MSAKIKPLIQIFSTGLALFSMFFGAGNVVFPLLIGREAGTQVGVALLGIGISGVLFPFLGLIAMMHYRGDLRAFLRRLGEGPGFICLFLLNIIMGPIVISRLFTLMHASITMILPISLELCSVLLCALVFALTYRAQRIISLLGIILTPVLLLVLALLVIAGLRGAPDPVQPVASSWTLALNGLKGGYQMMDLLGALLFSTLIIPHVMGTSQQEGNFSKNMIGASVVAALLLLISYAGLGWVAAHHSAHLSPSLPPEALLGALSYHVLGESGAYLASAIVFLACLTTAISLAAVFAHFLQHDLFKEKIGPKTSLGIALSMPAMVATLGFEGIMRLASPLLDVIYPALIVLCLVNIARWPVRAPVFFSLGFTAGALCMRMV
ncbi:MAG: branched-chain amino acid transport system II carrier protein [Chlamydiia bacterium]|nr:branched-chain amino acid transport system II carrier protein [Chlamydiia bacterium]